MTHLNSNTTNQIPVSSPTTDPGVKPAGRRFRNRSWINILDGILKDARTIFAGTFEVDAKQLDKDVRIFASACVLPSGGVQDSHGAVSYTSMIEASVELLAQRPLNVKLHCVLIKALYAMERHDEAKSLLADLKKIDPSSLRSDRELRIISRTIWVLDNWWLPSAVVPFVVLGQVAADTWDSDSSSDVLTDTTDVGVA